MDMRKNQLNLYPLGRDKEIISKTLSEDEDIIALLIPDYDSLTTTEDLDVILKQHLYKTIAVDNTQGESRAYICIETYVPSVENDSIKEIGIVINVFCATNLLELSDSDNEKFLKKGFFGNRLDMLIDGIDRCLNGKRGIGIGKLRLRPRNPIVIYQPVNGYYGKSLEYIIYDFNDIPLV